MKKNLSVVGCRLSVIGCQLSVEKSGKWKEERGKSGRVKRISETNSLKLFAHSGNSVVNPVVSENFTFFIMRKPTKNIRASEERPRSAG